MGRLTNNVDIVANPATKFIKWLNPTEKTIEKGVKESGFYYWDKEKETNVAVEFPFVFQYLQDAVGIGGYLEKRKKNIFSNEVLNVYETPFDIKVFGDDGVEIIKTGFYYADQKQPESEMDPVEFKQLKAKIQKDGKNGVLQTLPKSVTGAKKCKILYILVEEEIWRMELIGSSLTAWDEFQKEQNGSKYRTGDKNTRNMIIWSDVETKQSTQKDGKPYNVPVFTYKPFTEEQKAQNEKVYKEQVEPYFNFILNKPIEEVANSGYDD